MIIISYEHYLEQNKNSRYLQLRRMNQISTTQSTTPLTTISKKEAKVLQGRKQITKNYTAPTRKFLKKQTNLSKQPDFQVYDAYCKYLKKIHYILPFILSFFEELITFSQTLQAKNCKPFSKNQNSNNNKKNLLLLLSIFDLNNLIISKDKDS